MTFEYKSLDQLGTISRGRSQHRPRNDPQLFGGKYPFIQTADVKNAPFYISDYSNTYNETGLNQSKLWPAGTLCITIAANIADTGILKIPACFPDSIMGFLPYENISDVRYIKYCFDILKREFQQISQGTAQDNLSWEKLSKIKFPVPDYIIQCRIADILSAYDDLIEVNQKQIRLLEEAARRLYKEWFVDLRFPGHENTSITDGIPAGWSTFSLSQIFNYTRGKSYSSEELSSTKGVYLINLKNINAWGGYKRDAEKRFTGTYSKSHEVKSGDIIMAVTDMTQERRLVGHVALVPVFSKKAIISMDLIKIIPKESVTHYFLYSMLRFSSIAEQISQYANGVNVLHLRPENITQIKVQIPSKDLMMQFEKIVANYYEKIEPLEKQILLLQEARDRLLPKLMSGEIEV